MSLRVRRVIAVALFLIAASQHVVGKEYFGILNYSPSKFLEKAESSFFYSIGNQLKYGMSVDETAPALFEGKYFGGNFVAVFPSPDNKKVALVSNKKLYVVGIGISPQLVLDHVVSYDPKEIGYKEIYYKWPTIQWDSKSRYIYIAKDKKQPQGHWQRPHSRDAILVRIDTENAYNISEMIVDFRSLHYFLVGSDGLCFDYALDNGDVIWKCLTENGVLKAQSVTSDGIQLDNKSTLTGRPFLSYKPNIYESDIWMSRYGFFVKRINEKLDGLFLKSKPEIPLIRISTGVNIKGRHVNGIRQMGGAVLPGGRYVLLNVWHDSFKGQLLLDSATGEYRELPKETNVYRNLNSDAYDDFVFSVGQIRGNEFKPSITFSN